MTDSTKWLVALAICGLVQCGVSTSLAADASTAQTSVKHSARYTRLLGTASGRVPVRFADVQASSPAPTHTVAWGGYYGYGPRYYGGYGPAYYGPASYYGGGYYGAGWGSVYRSPWNYYGSAPYGGFYGYGYRPYGLYGYRPYASAYQPWAGGYGGYGYGGYGYGGYAGFPSITPFYTTGYAGYAMPGMGYYGGCCYW